MHKKCFSNRIWQIFLQIPAQKDDEQGKSFIKNLYDVSNVRKQQIQ